jgi:hypothetical protein
VSVLQLCIMYHSLMVVSMYDLHSLCVCVCVTSCRNINGVLVERTVGEVLPAIQANLKGIDQVLTKLADEVVSQEKVCDKYRADNNIKMANRETSQQ